MRPVRCVLFDFGNTLFGHRSLVETISSCSIELGRPLDPAAACQLAEEIDEAAHSPDELRRGRDLDADVWTSRWQVLYGIADGVMPGLGRAVMNDMHAPHAWTPYSGTIATLRQLRSCDTAVGVVSNTGWDIRSVIRAAGVADCIDEFTLSCEIGLVKPDPAIFALACATLAADPAETLMVGDDPRADSGAVAAGLRALLLPPCAPGGDNGIESVVRIACSR